MAKNEQSRETAARQDATHHMKHSAEQRGRHRDMPVSAMLHMDERKLPELLFRRFAKRGIMLGDRQCRQERSWQSFGKPGRDPLTVGGVMNTLAATRGWTTQLSIAGLRYRWDTVVGADIAAHSYVSSFRDGVMVICADSPAWTTQLSYMKHQLQHAVAERLPDIEVVDIVVTGPQHQYRRFKR